MTLGWRVAIRASFWLVIALALGAWAWRDGTPRAMFERVALQPMPASVRDFQWRGTVVIEGFYVLRFTADSDDVRHMIAVHRLVRQLNPASAEEINRETLKRCVWLGMPFARLDSPVVYDSPQDRGERLVTDAAHQRVYLFR
jgi:hypothetical protein